MYHVKDLLRLSDSKNQAKDNEEEVVDDSENKNGRRTGKDKRSGRRGSKEEEAAGSDEGEDAAELKEVPSETERPRLCGSYRMFISFAGFLAFFNSTLIRLGTGMAIVCMSKPRGARNITDDPNCPSILEENSGRLYEFDWSSTLQGIINSGSFSGYLVGPFLGGFLSFKYGGKIIIFIATFLIGFMYFFVPELTRISPYFFFGGQILAGFFASWLIPSAFGILSHWAVPEERQIMIGTAMNGIAGMAAINYPLNGLICEYIGWEWIFYVKAIWLEMCATIVYFFVYDSPDKCSYVKKKEVDYILPRTPSRKREVNIPWRKIVVSIPVHAYIFTHFCMNYILVTFVVYLPMFMREVHHLQLSSNSLLSASPYVAAFCVRSITTFTFDKLRARLHVTKNCLRKSLVFIGVSIPSVSLIVITFLSCRYRYLVIAVFILFAATFELAFASGYALSIVDMTPSYNNVISGVAVIVANLAGLFSAIIAGVCTPTGAREEYNQIFYICLIFFVAAGFTFICFGSNELQPWGLADPIRAEPVTNSRRTSRSSIQ